MFYWVYLTILEQFLVISGTCLLISFIVFNVKVFHKLQLFLCEFILVFSCFLLNNVFRYSEVYFLKLLILVLSFLVLLFWESSLWVLGWNYSLEIEVLFLFSVCNLLMFINSLDLLLIYLVLECQSLIVYTFMVLFSVNEVSLVVESSLKYFILGGLASCILLLGVTVFYFFLGSTNLMVLGVLFSFEDLNSSITIGSFLILLAILFKLGVARLHIWSVDVCKASRFFLVLFLLTVPKMPLIFLFNLTLKNLMNFQVFWLFVLLVLVVFSIMMSVWGSVNQISMGSLFAFSSSGNFSIILGGFVLVTPLSFLNSWLYVYCYSLLVLFILGFFSSFLKLEESSLGSKFFIVNFYLTDLKGFDVYYNGVSLWVLFGLLSLMAVPPLTGFFIKYFLISSLVTLGFGVFGLVLILVNVIAVFVYLSLVKELHVSL